MQPARSIQGADPSAGSDKAIAPARVLLAWGSGRDLGAGTDDCVGPTRKPPQLEHSARLHSGAGADVVRVDGVGLTVNAGTHRRPPARAAWPAAESSLSAARPARTRPGPHRRGLV